MPEASLKAALLFLRARSRMQNLLYSVRAKEKGVDTPLLQGGFILLDKYPDLVYNKIQL